MSTKSRTKRVSKGEGKSYEPTAREIRRACASIRESWTEQERRKRAGLPKEEPWTPPWAKIDSLVDDDSPYSS